MADLYIYREREYCTIRYEGQMDPPHSKLPEHRANSSLFNVTNESPFETVN